MITDIHPYPAYKPSGVDWLGDVPELWEIFTIKNLARSDYKSFVDGDWIESPYITSDGIRLIQTGNIGIGEYREKGFRYISERTFTALRCTEFQPGDVLICRLGEPVARACLAPNLGTRMITSVDVCILKQRGEVNGKFIVYSMSSRQYLGWVNSLVRGSTKDRVSRSMLGSFSVPLPPFAEQAAIVRYLDYVDRRIRRYVAAKERLILLLEEERQAVINRAVTRGLDPNVPLKPSGTEWLGDVPAHWERRRLKRVLHRLIDCEHKTAPAVSASSYRVVRTSAVRGGSLSIAGTYCTSEEAFAEWTRRGNLEPGDVIFTREAPAGEACVVPSNLSLCLGQRTVLMKIDRNAYDPHFLVHMLYAGPPHHEIELASRGSTVPHFNVEDIGVLPVFTPPVPEQIAIVRYLDHEIAVIDAAITRARRQIELVQEYRTRLLADVVTGKLDVREAAATSAGRNR